jgi:hypothetical protein
MKIIVAGSRTLNSTFDEWVIYNKLDMSFVDWILLPDLEIVVGGAEGPDRIGKAWAKDAAIPHKVFLPNWQVAGKKAGILRNVEMGSYADALIAFWDGKSRGTRHMINFMLDSGKPVHVEIIEHQAAIS